MADQRMRTFPVPIDTSPDDVFLYEGLGKQDLKFHQALAELIDNSISASTSGDFFVIEIHIQKRGDTIELAVADDGRGISINDLEKHVLRIGGRGTTRGRLNEHGFGLKNSLCILTYNSKPFTIITRDDEAAKENLFPLVRGPFRRSMSLELGNETDWKENTLKLRKETGTRVKAETSFHFFKTLYPSATRLETLIERLLEHLGVIYRNILSDQRNEIWLRWRDISSGSGNWNNEKITGIEIPYISASEDSVKISIDSVEHEVKYKRGTLNDAEINDGSKPRPFPLKIYYQKNQRTQGIDVSMHGRIILPHTLELLWPDKIRHNDLNAFVGELVINDSVFSTVNNKTQLDPNNRAWELLLDKLNNRSFMPDDKMSVTQTEAEMRKNLMQKLKSIVQGSSTEENFPTWPGLGVKIDIMHTFKDGKQEIYEIKAGSAQPQDVYQLVMYWDGRVAEGGRPRLGRLVVKKANQNIYSLIDYWNKRKDAEGQKYNLELKLYDEIS